MNNDTEQQNLTQSTEYAGPPKAHDFQSNMNVTLEKAASAQEQPQQKQVQAPLQSLEQKNPQEKTEIPTSSVSTTSQEEEKHNNQDTELLELISRPDRQPEDLPVKKSFTFNFDFLSVYRKKVRDYITKHEDVFRLLNLFWITAKSAFYLVGLSFFILCFTLYMGIDFLVDDYLKRHALNNISVGHVERSLSSVVITNVQDKKNLFKIKSIKFDFSVADLLERKIPKVEIDSLNIFLTGSGTKNASVNFQDLARVFWQLGVLDNNSLFSIQSVILNNSVLYLDNKEYKLPINFNGYADFAQKKQITFPVSLETQYLTLNGNLLLNILPSGATWNLDVLSGKINIPSLENEMLTGKITTKTSRGRISSIKVLGTLTRNDRKKLIDLTLTPTTKGLFNATSSLVVEKDDKETFVISLNLTNVSIEKDFSSFSTDAPLFLKISNLKTGNFSIDSLQLSSTGNLLCNLNGCSYKLKEKGELTVFTPTYKTRNSKFFSVHPLKLSLEPTKGDTFLLNGDDFSFTLNAKQSNFDLRKQEDNDKTDTSISLSTFVADTHYNFEDREWTGSIASKVKKIENVSFSLSDGLLKSTFKNETHKTNIQASKFQFNKMPYFKLPVQLNLTVDSDDAFTATIDTQDKWISLKANGYFYPVVGEITAALWTNKPIVFEKGTPQPAEISSLFPSQIKDISGKLSFKGELRYKNANSISGPMQVLFDDVSFRYGNMQIAGLNSLMNLTHIVPFGTKPNQEIYIQSVLADLPFNNIHTQVFFDSSRKQFNISSMNLDLLGSSLSINPAWYAYDAPRYNVSLRGKMTPVQPLLDKTTLKDLKILGNGYLNVTGFLENNKFTLKNAELSVPSDGRIQYTPQKYISPSLESLKNLDFKQLSINLTEQNDKFELVFSADNKSNKIKKKTSFRFNINDSLAKYFLPVSPEPLPASLVEAKENF